jgi:hypothetical protein
MVIVFSSHRRFLSPSFCYLVSLLKNNLVFLNRKDAKHAKKVFVKSIKKSLRSWRLGGEQHVFLRKSTSY